MSLAAERPDLLLPPPSAVAADLLAVGRVERVVELAWPLALAGVAGGLASRRWWPGVVVAVALFFPRFGVAFHDLLHRSLGLSRRANDWWLTAVGLLALQSGHAAQAAHEAHHRHLLTVDDPEAAIGRLPWWRGLLVGPLFHPRLCRWALSQGSAPRAVVAGEAALCAAIVLVTVLLVPWTPAPLAVVTLVLVGDGIFPVLSQTFLHPRNRPTPLGSTRTVRGRLFTWYFLELGYHVEHHAYPDVPTRHVAELSQRIEPALLAAGVEPTRLR